MASIEKSEKKRNTSIITIFLWLLLIVVMSTIMIGSIFKTNFLEYDTTITLKIDVANILNDDSILEEDKIDIIEDLRYDINITETYECSSVYDYIEVNKRYLGLEGNIATYEIDFDSSKGNYIKFDGYNYDIDNYYILEGEKILDMPLSGVQAYTKELILGQLVYEFTIKQNVEMIFRVDETQTIVSPNIFIKQENNYIAYCGAINYSNGIVTYSASIIPNLDYTFCLKFNANQLMDPFQVVVYEEDVILESSIENNGSKNLQVFSLKVNYENRKEKYNFKVVSNGYPDIYGIYSNIKWLDMNKKQALLEYGTNNTPLYNYGMGYTIFVEKLEEGFTVSAEYENQPNWLVVNEEEIIHDELDSSITEKLIELDLDNNEYIPRYIYANFFKEDYYIEWNEKYQYIYIKDKNILYIICNGYPCYGNVRLQYQGDLEEVKVNTETKVICFYSWNCQRSQLYKGSTLEGKTLGITNGTTANVTVHKLIKDEIGNATYYVGLFENEETNVTDQIYPINTMDGIGNTVITIDQYDGVKPYYIYEVDENGNKLSSEELNYSKNEVLKDIQGYEEKSIVSNKSIVSMVGTWEENTVGTGLGEDYYVDNAIHTAYTYQDSVTISSNYDEQVYVVKLEAGEGGSINGDTIFVVKNGEKVNFAQNAVANAHYLFDKWVVIEDGIEKEVDPSNYVITKDTTFIAKFAKERYHVKYESSEGGRLEGSLEEIVEYGGNVVLVPSIVPDKNYEFDKWVVIENGVEIEVNIMDYKVEKDVTFIAKYNKIGITDTSDIALWSYIGIGIVSIFVIIIVILILKMRKK